jgi:hypothetical protein
MEVGKFGRRLQAFLELKNDGRWWIIDPEGYPFIHKAIVAFSDNSKIKKKYS